MSISWIGDLPDYPWGGEVLIFGSELFQVSNESLILAQNQRWRRA